MRKLGGVEKARNPTRDATGILPEDPRPTRRALDHHKNLRLRKAESSMIIQARIGA
jgi:hypothetical protein